MKKFWCAVLSAVIIFCLCSCNALTRTASQADGSSEPSGKSAAESKNPMREITRDLSPYYKSVSLTNGYDHLENNAQRELYRRIYGSVFSVEEIKTTDNCYYLMKDIWYTGEESVTDLDMVIAYAAFKNDHPEYFWLDTECVTDANQSYGSYMYIYSVYSPDEAAQKAEEFNAAAAELISKVPDNLSEYERELYIHDLLCDYCEYDDEAADVQYGDEDYTEHYDAYDAYGALVNGEAVCQGYADAFAYLLAAVGINNTQVTGQEHIWNCAELGGEWYNVDITWDITAGSHDYFNITNEEILRDHEIAPLYTEMTEAEILGDGGTGLWFNLFVPECNATEYSYYNQ